MKLRQFDPSNTITTSRGNPTVSVNLKAGLFNINKAAAEALKLTTKSKVLFFQDEEDAINWYVAKVEKNGFELREKEGSYNFNNKSLAIQIRECFEGEGSYKMVLGAITKHEEFTLYGLIVINNQ